MDTTLDLIGRTAELFAPRPDRPRSRPIPPRQILAFSRHRRRAGSIGQAGHARNFQARSEAAPRGGYQREQHGRAGVRDLRSSIGYSSGEFATFAIDAG